jgi:hypothetical protein
VPVVGSRFFIEAGFIIAVAVVAGIERLGTWSIIGLVAVAWLIVAVVEIVIWARQVAARQPRTLEVPEPPPAPALPPRERVVARSPAPHREPAAPPEPQVRRPEPAEPPRIVAVPSLPAEPEPAPEPVPEPVPVVAFLPVNDAPREWNLWELERAARDHATDDVARNEERSYLLIYLREFAGPDGTLPTDFDGLVRDAFGDLLHAVA